MKNKNNHRNVLIGLAIILLVTTGGMASASGIDKILTGYTGGSDNTVRAYINAQKVDSIGEIQLSLQYDPKVIVPDTVIKGEGNLISGATFTSNIDNDAGNVQININTTNSGGISGDGSLAIIIFKIVGSEGDTSSLNINLVKVVDSTKNDVDLSTINITNKEYTVSKSAIVSTPTSTVTEPTETAPKETVPEETVAQPTEAETTAPEETTPVPTETTPQESPGFAGIMSIVAILAVLIVIYRRR